MNEQQWKFISSVITWLAVTAALRKRSKTYKDDVSDSDKQDIRKSLGEFLNSLDDKYKEPVDEQQHIANIESLSNKISQEYGKLLCGGRFMIGSAQKAINLYLKYLWCLGKIPTPPHCPFDRRIIQKLKDHSDVRWTTLDNVEVYKNLVKEARKIAKTTNYESMAQWELEQYNDI